MILEIPKNAETILHILENAGYEDVHKRQYILFAMTMGYGIVRMLALAQKKVFKIFSVIGLVLLCWTFGYFGKSVTSWFGNVWEVSGYKGCLLYTSESLSSS